MELTDLFLTAEKDSAVLCLTETAGLLVRLVNFDSVDISESLEAHAEDTPSICDTDGTDEAVCVAALEELNQG